MVLKFQGFKVQASFCVGLGCRAQVVSEELCKAASLAVSLECGIKGLIWKVL